MKPPKHPVERLCICVPNHSGTVQQKHYMSMYALMHQLGSIDRDINVVTEGHTIVHTARQSCVAQALASEECTHVLWIDDDMVFTREHYMALEVELVMNDLDYLSGMCFSNSSPTRPCVFGRVPGIEEFGPEAWWSGMTDYPGCQREATDEKGRISVVQPWGEHRRFRVYATGFAFVLMTKRMLDDMRRDEKGEIIEGYHHFICPSMNVPNEDVAFCINAGIKGYKLYADSRINIGHIQRDQHVITEETYNGHGDAPEYMGSMERFKYVDDESVDAEPADLPTGELIEATG